MSWKVLPGGKSVSTHTRIAWVELLIWFLYDQEKLFVLIEISTSFYISVYFWDAFWLCYQLIMYAYSDTDLRNLISVNSSWFFWCFSVDRPDGIPWSPNGCSMVVRTVFSGSSDMCSALSSGQVLLYVRTHVRCHHHSDEHDRYARSRGPRVRTSWKLRPDGWPTKAINSPVRPFSPFPTKSTFRLFVSNFLWCFWSNIIPLCLFAFSITLQVFFLSYSFQFLHC